MAAPAAGTEPGIQELERDAQSARLRVHVPANLIHFRGHFNGAPILPGVTQLHWATNQARRLFALAGEPTGLRSIKFQHVIQPDDTVDLSLNHDRERERVSFRFSSERGTHSSGQLLWPDAR